MATLAGFPGLDTVIAFGFFTLFHPFFTQLNI